MCMFFQIVVGLEPPSPETGILVWGIPNPQTDKTFLLFCLIIFTSQKKLGGKQFPCLSCIFFFVFFLWAVGTTRRRLVVKFVWGLEWCWMSHQLFHQSHARGKLGGGSTSCLVGSVFLAGTSTTRPWKCSMWRWSNEPRKHKETGIALVDRTNLYFAVSKCVFC